ncbi:MAG: DUF4238 domain-containing protein [Ruminococcaceae bacterium]|nr:DUF4238 domain-containing protein [Oscillospiraceae bacterium]
MGNSKGVNSHIQMPKFVLRRFNNSYNNICCYDVKNNKIVIKGNAKSINTEYNYYSDPFEKDLSKNIEKPFSDILAYIDKIEFNKEKVSISDIYIDGIKTFMYALMARDSTAMEKNKENSFYSQFIPIQKRHEFVVTHGIYYAKKKSVFEDYLLTFIVNETEKSFILPIKGLYEFDINGMPAIILPISPTVAICLYDKSFVSDIFDNTETPILKVNKPELIEKMNEVAFITQKQRKYGYVISTQKEELYRIKEKLSICL